MTVTRRGRIPSDLGSLADMLADHESRLRDVEGPDALQSSSSLGRLFRTVNYLDSLTTSASSGAPALLTGTVPNDNVTRWFATSPDTRVENLDVPTNKLLVTASCGEASIQPGGSFVIAYVSYSVRDVNDVIIPGHGLGQNTGRRYTNIREGIGLTTNQQLVVIDPVTNPGPYLVRAFFGMWVASANTTACSCQFLSPSLVVQVIGDGVPSE